MPPIVEDVLFRAVELELASEYAAAHSSRVRVSRSAECSLAAPSSTPWKEDLPYEASSAR